MNDTSRNKLFAIVQNTYAHPDLGYTIPHIFGAIFDVNADGLASDFEAVDFDGKTIRNWERNNFGKSEKIHDHLVGAEQAIFFPITVESAVHVKAVMAELSQEQKSGRNPTYFGGVPPLPRDAIEDKVSQIRQTYIGPQRCAQKIAYQRVFDKPIGATNCMKFLQDVLLHAGRIPIAALSADGVVMPRNGDSREMKQFMSALAGNETVANNHPQQAARMIDCGENRKAFVVNFAYRNPHGEGSLTAALNRLAYMNSEGKEMPLAQFLITRSSPFYEPGLHEAVAHPHRTSGCAR